MQKRIIKYYAELLAIQARPVHQRPVWRKPVRPEGAAAGISAVDGTSVEVIPTKESVPTA